MRGIRAVHQDENLYPDAQTFNPDRWMPDPAAKLSERKFEYFAFSVGPQSCIGAEALARVSVA